MPNGPLRGWNVEKTKINIWKVVLVLCILVVSGSVLIFSYYKQFPTSVSFYHQYTIRKGFKGTKTGHLLRDLRREPEKTEDVYSDIAKDTRVGHVIKHVSKNTKPDKPINDIAKTYQISSDIAPENLLAQVADKRTKTTVIKLNDTITPNKAVIELNETVEEDVTDVYSLNDTYSTTTEDGKISWNDSRLDILHMPKLEFDSRFKNPCWYEPLTSPSPYQNNTVTWYSPSAKKTLNKLTERWAWLYEEEERPSRLRCLPYFMIIGQPKCGSTDLFWKIVKHPDIDHPPIKELHWWTRSRQGRRFSYSRLIPLSDYVDMFDGPAVQIQTRWENSTDPDLSDSYSRRDQIITGEASVSLLWDNDDWKKYPENGNQPEPLYLIPHYIHHVIPHVKLILMVREPADRMYSDYLYFHSDAKSADDFHNSVVRAVDLYENCVKLNSPKVCVYDRSLSRKVRVRLRVGMYSVYLRDWFSVFPKSQFMVLRLEDYSKHQIRYLRQIYSFLGQRMLSENEEDMLFENEKSNVRKSSDRLLGGMHEKTRHILENFYRPYNTDLSTMLQDPRFLWDDLNPDS